MKTIPRPKQVEDLDLTQGWPSFEFRVLNDTIDDLSEPLVFSASWRNMPVDAAVQMKLRTLPSERWSHRMQSTVAHIGTVIRIDAPDGSVDVDWLLHGRVPMGEHVLIAEFVEGEWIDSAIDRKTSTMPSRRYDETFTGPVIHVSKASHEGMPAALEIAADSCPEGAWNSTSTSTPEQTWREIQSVDLQACSVGTSGTKDRYPMFWIGGGRSEHRLWDLVIRHVETGHEKRVAETLKDLWKCGTGEAFLAARKTPTAVASSVPRFEIDEIMRMFEGMPVDMRVIRSLW
jgi:hypothetical protein